MWGSRRQRFRPVLRGGASRMTAEAIVIGGGFYGCETALELKRLGFGRIVPVETRGLLRRASFGSSRRDLSGRRVKKPYSPRDLRPNPT